MMEWITGLTGLEQVFFGCAVFGGVLLAIRMGLQLFAGVGDMDVDHDIDVDASLDHAADTSFTFFSVHGLLAFFTMFGMIGLVMTREVGAGPTPSIFVAFMGGLISMAIIQLLFAAMFKLQSSGTLDMKNAVGEEGSVYMTIPADGRGKVQVVLQNRLGVFDAVAERKTELKTKTHVRVVRVIEGNVLVVEKA